MAQTQAAQKGPGGRPKLDDEERRCRPTHIRWTIAEYNSIHTNADLAGVSVSEYVRRRSLGLPVVAKHARSDARLVHELNAIGVNLNQIARNLNTGRKGVRAVDLDDILVQLRDALGRAIEQLDD
ncbi:MAG: MobC family plasmid mobilization relaxosome protein [Phycisphaera sp.]|nr:MAG: MobC family plasmid mobilization relaxosome protein [Phycisphaera sp.]